MNKFILAAIVVAGSLVGLFVWFVGLPEHSYQLVSPEYNFSAVFPDTPPVTNGINDEGLPKTEWTLKHDHGTWTEYFNVSVTCYTETLDLAKEFDGADTDPALALNGVKILTSGRTAVEAVETGRELPAFCSNE